MRVLLTLIAVPLLATARWRWPLRGRALRVGAASMAGAVCASFLGSAARHVLQNVAAPREWDYLCFWIWGRAAHLGLDPYLPEHLRRVAESLHPSPEFQSEILATGFFYPPPSILLFLPLGFLSPRAGLVAWSAFQAALLIGLVVVLARRVLGDPGKPGLLAALTLCAASFGLQQTFFYAQTNVLVALLLALAWGDRDRDRAGAWVALGAAVKPWVAVLGVWLLVRRRWRSAAVAVLCMLALAGASVAVLGPAAAANWLRSGARPPVPGAVYVEWMNQSLLGTVLRGLRQSGPTAMGVAAYGALALPLAALVLWAGSRCRDTHPAECFSSFVAAGLLLYPGTLSHYSFVLVVPVAALWFRDPLPAVRDRAWAASAVTLLYLLPALRGGAVAFWAFALLGAAALWRARSAWLPSSVPGPP